MSSRKGHNRVDYLPPSYKNNRNKIPILLISSYSTSLYEYQCVTIHCRPLDLSRDVLYPQSSK